MILIREVPTHLVLDVWPVVEPMLAKAARHHPFFDTDCIFATIMAGKSALLVVIDNETIGAAVVMEVQSYPNGRRIGQVWGMGGLPGILKRCRPELEEVLDQWCNQHECDTIAVIGRPGWRRLLRNVQSVPLALAWRKIHGRLPGRTAAATSQKSAIRSGSAVSESVAESGR